MCGLFVCALDMQAATVGGIAMMFAAAELLSVRSDFSQSKFGSWTAADALRVWCSVSPAHSPPSDGSCSAAFWVANLGFDFTFLPLFAKTW